MKEFKLPQNDFTVRYHDLPGEGTPIVFLHGLGCASSMDYPAVAAEPPLCGRRSILVDLLGAGFSDKPASFGYSVEEHAAYLHLLVQSLALERFVLFGHSLGGAVAIELASLCPERIAALILTESNLDPSGECAVSRFIASQPEANFLAYGYSDLIAQNRAAGNTLWAASLALWLPLAVYRFSLSAARGGTPSWRQTLYGLPVSKTYLFGERTLPDADFAELPEHGVRVGVVPRAGHGMAWDNPAGLAKAIADAIPFEPA